MKKISRIKMLFVALPIMVIALLLFIRWNEYGKSYKSITLWGMGNMKYSEQTYYSSRIKSIIIEWQKAGPRIGNHLNNTYFILDLERNAIWLEKDGQLVTECYLELPQNNVWKLKFSSVRKSVDLPGKTILCKKERNIFLSGVFNFYCNTNNQMLSYHFDLNRFNIGPYPAFFKSNGSVLPNEQDYTSFIVSEEEYNKYNNSLAQKNLYQSSEKEKPEQVTLQENKLGWFDIEKYLYMEIDGQIQNAGYKLDSLEIGTSPNYTGAYAVIQGYGESVLYKFVDWVSGTKIIQAYFKIDYLGDNIWYAKTAPHPNQKLKSDRKLNLEFLVFADEQISRSRYRKYIKIGRKIQKTDSYLSPKWKTSLPNGLSIKLIGISSDKEPGIWWGPDGSALELPEYVKIEPLNNLKNITFIAWQIKQPENREGMRLNYEFDSAKDIQAIPISNKYGNFENVMISVFNNTQEKTDFKIIIKDNDKITKLTAFKYISLIKGKDQGFVIENGEE